MREFFENKLPTKCLFGFFFLISLTGFFYLSYNPHHITTWVIFILSLIQVIRLQKKLQSDKLLLTLTPRFFKIRSKKIHWSDVQSAKLHKPLLIGRAIKLIIKTKTVRYYLPLENFSRNDRQEIFAEFEKNTSITFVGCTKASLDGSLGTRLFYTLFPLVYLFPLIYCLIFLLFLWPILP